MGKTFDTTPTAKHLIALANQKWKPDGAISELVDNSFGDARGDANKVVIIYDKRERKLTVRDDGKGMTRIGSLFQLGNTVGWSPSDIGQFGSGGTMALLWLASEIRIYTMRDGKVMHDHIRWKDHIDRNEYPQVSDEWEEPTRNTPTALRELGHGTQIEMWVRRERSLKEDQIQRELSRIYAPGLRHGKRIEWMTISSKNRDYKQTLKGDSFPMPTDPSKIITFRLSMPSENGVLQASGVAALVEDLPWKQSVVSVGFGHRVLMTTRDCYQSPDGETCYGAGVAAYVDLIGGGWKPKLSTTKDEIDDAHARARLMHEIFLKIEPLLEQTEQDRLAIVLDGIALELTDALNGINDPDFDLGDDGGHGAAGPGNLRDDRVIFDDVVRPFKPIDPKVVDPTRKGPYPGGDRKPPAARLRLHLASDKEIDGAMCRMAVISEHETNLRVEINKEHEVVEELLKPRQDRLPLNMMVTREIASALIKHPQLMRRILARRVQAKLDTFTDDGSRERLLARLLMDSARRPRLDEAGDPDHDVNNQASPTPARVSISEAG
jgi:Histidine kinase-, DNA gyrase B-, and HSP90-like ATPase